MFLDTHQVLLMPNSWQRQFPIDADLGPPAAAQRPLLGTAIPGLPGLAVPTGQEAGLPTGVQLVAGRFREDRCLRVRATIAQAAGFSALAHLAPPR